jgi:hypothetical protein
MNAAAGFHRAITVGAAALFAVLPTCFETRSRTIDKALTGPRDRQKKYTRDADPGHNWIEEVRARE